jgi:hypothetical protein
MNPVITCIGLLALLLIALGMAVSTVRVKTDVVSGVPNDSTSLLVKLIRAHGNTAEYAPMLALLFYLLTIGEHGGWVIWTICVVTASRYLIAIGLILSSDLNVAHPLRFLGAFGTYLGGLALSAALIFGL